MFCHISKILLCKEGSFAILTKSYNLITNLSLMVERHPKLNPWIVSKFSEISPGLCANQSLTRDSFADSKLKSPSWSVWSQIQIFSVQRWLFLFAFVDVQKKLVSSKIEHAWHDNMKSFAKMHQKILRKKISYLWLLSKSQQFEDLSAIDCSQEKYCLFM